MDWAAALLKLIRRWNDSRQERQEARKIFSVLTLGEVVLLAKLMERGDGRFEVHPDGDLALLLEKGALVAIGPIQGTSRACVVHPGLVAARFDILDAVEAGRTRI